MTRVPLRGTSGMLSNRLTEKWVSFPFGPSRMPRVPTGTNPRGFSHVGEDRDFSQISGDYNLYSCTQVNSPFAPEHVNFLPLVSPSYRYRVPPEAEYTVGLLRQSVRISRERRPAAFPSSSPSYSLTIPSLSYDHQRGVPETSGKVTPRPSTIFFRRFQSSRRSSQNSGIMEYWNDGFMDRYYPERGWRSVRLRRTRGLRPKILCLVPQVLRSSG